MYLQPTNPSADIQRLIEDGYEVEIRNGHLVLHAVPYVTATKIIRRGMLVSTLHLVGDRTCVPDTHVIMFAGEFPCDRHGSPLSKIENCNGTQDLGDGLVIHHHFSSKPLSGQYADYYEKMTTYAAILSNEAAAIEPDASARTFRVIETASDSGPFRFTDTASSRAGISALAHKLAHEIVGIVGLGGTGSYVADLVVKTHVPEVHFFDGDVFGQHNAFRAPGAPTLDVLKTRPLKVEYFKGLYDSMRRGIHAHGIYLDQSNIEILRNLTFVFLCMDAGPAKQYIIEALEGFGIPYIDAGMGLDLVDGRLTGSLRTTLSQPERREAARARIPVSGAGHNDLYSRNIQVAELNSLLADLAVIKWKKYRDFYADLEDELTSVFNIDGNQLLNEDAA